MQVCVVSPVVTHTDMHIPPEITQDSRTPMVVKTAEPEVNYEETSGKSKLKNSTKQLASPL